MLRPKATLAFLTPLAALSMVLAAPAHADKIYLSDGSIVDQADVTSETIAKVDYKDKDGKKQSVASELVLKVDYTESPSDFTPAEFDFRTKAFNSSIAVYGDYLSNLKSKGDRDHPWAPAAARYRIAHIHKLMNNVDELKAAVGDLEANHADSRYVPIGLLELADAQRASGDGAGAIETVKMIEDRVKSGALPQRWLIESKVRRALLDSSLKGEALERELDRVAKTAAAFPTARTLARAEQGRSMVARGAASEAVDMMRELVKKANGTDSTMAAAYTALGNALFALADQTLADGEAEAAIELYREARLAFMRVVVSYEFEATYVAESAYYAGRCFVEVRDEEAADNARRLFRYVIFNYSGSTWAEKSKTEDRKL